MGLRAIGVGASVEVADRAAALAAVARLLDCIVVDIAGVVTNAAMVAEIVSAPIAAPIVTAVIVLVSVVCRCLLRCRLQQGPQQ